MTVQSYLNTSWRIGKFKGDILKHAQPFEVLSRAGRQVKMPKNNSNTYVARKFLPYGASSTDANTINRFFSNGTGDRTNTMVQANQTSEGVTPVPDAITPYDTTVVIQQYSCLYGFTDQTYDLGEDDIAAAMTEQIGERVTLVNEQIVYGQLKAGSNQYYGGTGTTRATVNGAVTLNLLRKIAQNLMANHGQMTNSILKASGDFATSPISQGFTVYGHTDMEPDLRDLPNFVPVEKYASGTALPYEIGSCERFRFILSPDLPAIQDAGAAVGATGLYSTSGSNIDVYQFVVTAKDSFSQIAVRGLDSLDPTMLMPGDKSKSDPLGQRGYAGSKWYKAVMRENDGWMAIGNVGRKSL